MYIGNTNGATVTFVNESDNVTVNYIDFGTFAQGGGRGTLTIKGGMVTVNTSTRFYGGEGTTPNFGMLGRGDIFATMLKCHCALCNFSQDQEIEK